MRKSAIVLISGGIILATGFAVLGFVAQSALSEIRQTEYSIAPKEVIEIKEQIGSKEFFSGIYVVELLEYQEGDTVNVQIKDPDGMPIVSKELSSSFIIENFDFKKSGEYTMMLENTSFRSIIKVSAALGGQVYSGSTDPLITVAMPSYVVITGIIIVIAGGLMYYKERSSAKSP